MRILHIVRSADPTGGGPIEAVTRLGREHQIQGRAVEVLTLDAPHAPWLRGFPLDIHPVGPVRGKYGYTRKLVPWIREHRKRFDVMIINGIWQYQSFGAWRALRNQSTPYVVFPHGMLDPWFKRRYPLKHLKKRAYWPWADYRVLRDAAAVLFTSEEERIAAKQSFARYTCNEMVVGYGTARPPQDGERLRGIFHTAFPETNGRRIILFLGRLHEKKGCDLLIRAFGELVRRRPALAREWSVVLAGPDSTPSYGAMLSRLIELTCPTGSVFRTGMLTGELRWGAYHAAEGFILPSHQENFGVAVAEAVGCGLPVFISDKVNIWREITDAGAGVVASDTPEGTIQLLERLTEMSPEGHQLMRERALNCFVRFDAVAVAKRMATILQTIVRGPVARN